MRVLFAAVISCVTVAFLLTSCANAASQTLESPQYGSEPTVAPTQPSAPETTEELSAWVVYWDVEAAESELTEIDGLDALFHFSAIFRPDGSLFIPEKTAALYDSLRSKHPSPGTLHYLTVVNDVVVEGGNSYLKDTSVLTTLLASKESRAAHIADLIAIAKGYDGLEIDYETLHRVEGGLAENYALFAAELWEAAEKAGLRLRIVLEPGFPVEQIAMPEGPEYAVMLYNLFGGHSGPGPKADADFIRETVLRMEALPSDVTYAFATGGFDWSADNSSASEVTELEALALLEKVGSEPKRDPDSNCLVFSYEGSDGEHTVWFADGETLRFWMDCAFEVTGRRQFSLWRIGGNSPESLGML